MAKRTNKKIVDIKPCRKVITFDSKTKKSKGWLLEVVSDRDKFTKHLRGQIYLTVVNSGGAMDYHMHAGADYFVTCLKGRVREVIYKSINEKQEIKMGDEDFKTVFLPKNHPHRIENLSKEPAYVLVYRYPSWSADIREQFDIPKNQIRNPEAWVKIRAFIKNFNKNNKR